MKFATAPHKITYKYLNKIEYTKRNVTHTTQQRNATHKPQRNAYQHISIYIYPSIYTLLTWNALHKLDAATAKVTKLRKAHEIDNRDRNCDQLNYFDTFDVFVQSDGFISFFDRSIIIIFTILSSDKKS